MTEDEVRAIAKMAAEEGVGAFLTKIGIDPSEAHEWQRDMNWVRTWRTTSEAATRQGVLAVLTIVLSGICGLIWLAIQGK